MVSAVSSANREQNPVVVCVDDDPQVLSAMKRLLRREPYDLLTTDRPSTALRWIGKRKVDLLITDLKMPEMSGTDLIKVVEERSPDTQSLLLTGYPEKASDDTEVQPRLITKPWNDSEFKETIRSMVVAREPSRGPAKIEAGRPSPSAQVLVADTDPEFRSRAAGALSSEGFDLQLVTSGGEALGILRSREMSVEMVLVSPEAVQGGEVEFIRLVRRLVPGIYVIVLADGPERDRIAAWYEAGASSLLPKSISSDRLIDFMKRSVSPARRSRREALKIEIENDRRSEASWQRKLLHRLKMIVHAPSATRSGELRTLAMMTVAAIALGTLLAAGIDSTVGLLSPEDRLREILAERVRPQSPQDEAVRRWYMSRQLDLHRQMNEDARRYDDAQLFERRWERIRPPTARVPERAAVTPEERTQEIAPWKQERRNPGSERY